MTAKVTKLKSFPVYKFRIELAHTEPSVWRQFAVQSAISMHELHEIVQIVMGWTNSHLYMFRNDGIVITEANPEDDWHNVEFRNARKLKVADIFKKNGDSIAYEYDFGDSWTHLLRLEGEIRKSELAFSVPRCLAGANACPPENCGGPPGFDHLKEVIADPHRKDFKDTIQWLDEYYPNYDPKEFSLGAVNKILNIGASKFLKIAAKFYG